MVGAAVGAIADPKGAYKAAKSALSNLYNAAKKIFPSSKNQSNSPSSNNLEQMPKATGLAEAKAQTKTSDEVIKVGDVLRVNGVTEADNRNNSSTLTPGKKVNPELITIDR